MPGVMSGVKISALGCYVPPAVLSNHDLEKMVETSDEWILQRVGISERHIAAQNAVSIFSTSMRLRLSSITISSRIILEIAIDQMM